MEKKTNPNQQGLSKLAVAAALKGARGDSHALRGSHPADTAGTFIEETLIRRQASNEAQGLRLREYALHFINRGEPVPCKECGNAIPPERLRAMQNAVDHCVPCLSAREAEANSGPRRGGANFK